MASDYRYEDDGEAFCILPENYLTVHRTIQSILIASRHVQLPTRIIHDYEDVTVSWASIEDGREFLQAQLGYDGSIGFVNVQLYMLERVKFTVAPGEGSHQHLQETKQVALTTSCSDIETLIRILQACISQDVQTLEAIAKEEDGRRIVRIRGTTASTDEA